MSMSSCGMNQRRLDDLDGVLGLLSGVYTFIAFLAALLLMPCCFVAYCLVRCTHSAFLALLSRRYPNLEFVRTISLRTAMDTHRNQGVISVLLRVRGAPDVEQIRSQLQEGVVDRLGDDKMPCFPHLRTVLTTRWGRYAWLKPKRGFNVQNHVTLAPAVFRARPIGELNIQEYVDAVVGKYLPPEAPPWHLTVVPAQGHFYLLLRVHHLLLAEDRVGLGDLLLLRDESAHTLNEDEENFHLQEDAHEPLVSLGRPLEALPSLLESLWACAGQVWSACKNNITKPKKTAMLVVQLATRWTLTLPRSALREVVALRSPAKHPGTLVEWINRNRGQLLQAARELACYCSLLYTGPRILLEELLISHQAPWHQLQTASLCGRKVVAWSDDVPLSLVRGIVESSGASPSEVYMCAVSGALRGYFQQAGARVPTAVLATARFFPLHALLTTATHHVRPTTVGGSLCLELPTDQECDAKGLSASMSMLRQTRARQPILYLASLSQLEHGLLTRILPTLVVRVVLNYLTRRYTVSLTEVAAVPGHPTRRQMLWGQPVDSAIYWRPPQANICLSLSVITYGDSVRLGVMSDALLSPHHKTLVTCFTRHIHTLAELVQR